MIGPQTLLQNRYLVIKQIGQGGMGAVYVATDQRFGSTVALKETFFTDATLRKAFEREAHLLNRLRHPALPRVSDHFIEDEGQFLVMEFIAGEDLSEMLKAQGGAFPVKEVLGWADQLLDALDYLHTQESPVIHRDIKPQNLKLTSRGQIILLDFGLAKGTPLQVSQVTATGSIFGYSRNYAPIEQIQGTGTNLRSDLYSLAATLYHLMTGAPPPDALTRATSVLNGQPDPLVPANQVHGQITPAVAEVLMRAMSQNAGQRPQSAAAMREDLAEAGKQTLVSGNVTNAQAVAAATLLEQDTQLMGTQAAGAQTSTSAARESAESVAGLKEATHVDALLATDIGDPPPATNVVEQESETTQLASKPIARHALSGHRAGIAVGAFILVLIAAVVFAMTRRAATPSGNTQAPAEVINPSTNSSQPPQTNTNQINGITVKGDSRNTATQRSEPAGKTTKATSKERSAVPNPPTPPDGDPTVDTDTTDDTTTTTVDGQPNYEQIRRQKKRAAMERRRAAAEQQRAERERRRAEETQRRATQP